MSVHTRSRRLAQQAYACVAGQTLDKEYVSFAKKFPALIHTCGLAQAIAFALAKKGRPSQYASNLAEVLHAGGHPDVTSAEVLAEQTREHPVAGYLRLSRDAIEAAAWLKRYVEARSGEET